MTPLLIALLLLIALIVVSLAVPKVGNLFAVIYTRLTSATPHFFRGLSKFFLTLTAVCLSIQPDVLDLVNQLTSLGITIPGYLQDIGKYAAVAGVISSIVSKLAVDRDKMNDEVYKDVK